MEGNDVLKPADFVCRFKQFKIKITVLPKVDPQCNPVNPVRIFPRKIRRAPIFFLVSNVNLNILLDSKSATFRS